MGLALKYAVECASRDLYMSRWLAGAVAGVTVVASLMSYPELIGSSYTSSMGAMLWIAMMVVIWWASARRIISQDSNVNDRKDPLALPARRLVLLAEKLVLVAVCIFVPRALGDLAVSAWAGSDLGNVALHLPVRYCAQFAMYVLPSMLLAALTRTGTQFFTTAASLALLWVVVTRVDKYGWSLDGAAPWIPFWTLLVAGGLMCLVITAWMFQGGRRGLGRATAVLALGLSLLGAPWMGSEMQWGLHRAWQHRPDLDSQLRLEFDDSALMLPASSGQPGKADRRRLTEFDDELPVPVRLAGVPASIHFSTEGFTYQVRKPDGTLLTLARVEDRRSRYSVGPPLRGAELLLRLDRRLKDLNVDELSIELRVRVEAFERSLRTGTLSQGRNVIPGLGACMIENLGVSFCTSSKARMPIFVLASSRYLLSGGDLQSEAAVLAIPRFKPFKLVKGYGAEISSHELEVWKYLAPVDVVVTIPHYRLSKYSWTGNTVSID